MPMTCSARRHLAKRDDGERDREQRLALHDHAGEADRHAMRDAKGLRQKLAEKQRDADRDQERPRHIRLAHEQARHRRDGKAQRRHQRRRQFVEREPARDEAKAPDHGDEGCEEDVGGLHGGDEFAIISMPSRLAILRRTSTIRIAGAVSAKKRGRCPRSIVRIWSQRTTPAVISPSGRTTSVGHPRTRRVIGQTIVRGDTS